MRMLRVVDSSNVESVGYDPETLRLRVGFVGGSAYEYLGVRAIEFVELVTAPSVGKWLNSRIKTRHDHTKLDDEEKPAEPKRHEQMREALELIASLEPRGEVGGVIEPTLRSAIDIARAALL